MYLILNSHDYDGTKIVGLFTTLELAVQCVEGMDDVEPFADDEYDEYDPESLVKGYWSDVGTFFIHKVEVTA